MGTGAHLRIWPQLLHKPSTIIYSTLYVNDASPLSIRYHFVLESPELGVVEIRMRQPGGEENQNLGEEDGTEPVDELLIQLRDWDIKQCHHIHKCHNQAV
ncbi:hypothetical protein ECANGB1_1223 [Enterospora canceri]|uniref:Uncharacterized protein n=1 Tax=Enterospora canceri TaxID=1081671 RepID=A0A1Y1S6N6_9MICR|nr:hypothetical protein ECANGB1_1223 [Enterospora canceri]